MTARAKVMKIMTETKSDACFEQSAGNDADIVGMAETSSSARERHKKSSLMTPKLAAVLDEVKLSDRDAVRVLAATVEALNLDTQKYVLNHTSIYQQRRKFRQERYNEYREHFQFPDDSFLVIHWDGKMFSKRRGTEKVDRQAVIATWGKEEQLPGIPDSGGKGSEIADVVFAALVDWGINEAVMALGCDTTSTNTGLENGACVNLEKYLKRELLYLPCRHHIYEVILKGVFDKIMGPTSGPEVLFFKRFMEA